MALYSNPIALTASWQEISTGESTVLIQVDDLNPGRVLLAVVDTLAGDAAGITSTHYLTPIDNPVANFYGLGGKRVVAKKRAASESPSIIVTKY